MTEANTNNCRILVVDDESTNVLLLEHLLSKEGFTQVVSTTNPEEGLAMVAENEPDLVLLDLMMPVVDGFGFMKQVRSSEQGSTFLPILVLTADTSGETKRRALSAGANDFLSKPFDPVEVILRTRNLLEIRMLNRALSNQNEALEQMVGLRTAELESSRMEVLERLNIVTEHSDGESTGHTRRVGQSTALIAASLGLPPSEVDTIRRAAPLHDIGNFKVPDEILLKPGALTEQEFEIVKTHTTHGAELLDGSEYRLLQIAKEIALCHHERFDGSGYPQGLKGEEIPLVARMVAVADVFDVVTHDRCYRSAWPVDKATKEIEEQAGRQFDPSIVSIFVDLAGKQRIVV